MFRSFSLLLILCGFGTVAYGMQCYSCINKPNDASCNIGIENCTSMQTQCLTIVKGINLVDKRCANTSDCTTTSGMSVNMECCNGTLCNKITTNWPAPVVDILTESVGMNPKLFLSTVTTYQVLFTLIYVCTIAYVIMNTPRTPRGAGNKISQAEYRGGMDEVIELE